MLLAGVRHGLGAVALSNHHQRAAVFLEEVNVGVHTLSRGRAHGAASVAFRRLGGTCVEDRVILDVLRQTLTGFDEFLHAGVSDVAGDDDRAGEVHAGGNRVLREFLAHFGHRTVQINVDLAAFARTAKFFGDQLSRVGVEFFNPDAVLVDLGLDVAVSRAAYAHADRAAGTVTRQADHADVVSHVLAAELSAQADVAGFFKELLFEFEVAEGAAGFVARGGQLVVVVRGSELDGKHRALGRRAADHKSDVIGRAGSRTQRLHLVDEVGHERGRIQNGLGFLEEVGLVGRAAALDHAQELVFAAFGCFDVDLSRQVATGVLFFVHRKRCVLGITQGIFRVGFVNAAGKSFFIAEAGPNVLTLFAVDDGRTGVLAQRQDALGGGLGVAQERQSDILVVFAGFRILKNLGNLFVVCATQQEVGVVEALLGKHRQCFRLHLDDLMALEFTFGHIVFGEQVVLRLVFAELEHRRVLEFRVLSHL